MKKKILKVTAGILFIPFVYLILAFGVNEIKKPEKPGHTVSSKIMTVEPKNFIIGTHNMDFRFCNTGGQPNGLWIGNNISNYLTLNYNSVLLYPSDNDYYGNFYTPYSNNQITRNLELINNIHNANLNFFFESIKFSYLMYAQRVVYEVPFDNNIYDPTVNYGFCYQNVNGELKIDENKTVLYNQKMANPQYQCICSGIIENLQHSDFFARQFDQNNWYFKPMVKADLTNIPDNTPIFKIVVNAFRENVEIPVLNGTITANDFKFNGIYSGGYIEKFYNINVQKEISVSGNKTNGLNIGRDDEGKGLKDCKVDFKIFWYGTADFWFDKLTVDDYYANKLFAINDNYEDKIADELNNISGNPGANFYAYHFDEIAYSQILCVDYLLDKIAEYNTNPNTDIKYQVSQSNWLNVNLMRNTSIGYKAMLKELTPQRLLAFDYNLVGWRDKVNEIAYIPINAFPNGQVDSRIPDEWRVNNTVYTNYLQHSIFGDKNHHPGPPEKGTLVEQVELAKRQISDIQDLNTKLYFAPQMQGEMYLETNSKLYGLREPINEEYQAQIMLAIAHGAEGVFSYIYQTRSDFIRTDNQDLRTDLRYGYSQNMMGVLKQWFTFGLFGDEDNNLPLPRTENLYGQNKWEYVKNLNLKISNWKPYLDNLRWEGGYSVHSEGANIKYIKDIISIHSAPDKNFYYTENCIDCDPQNERYWEMAFFNNDQIGNSEKYFMMVNRRCIPETNENLGDLRRLLVRFRSNQFSSPNTWKLSDVYLNQSIFFDINNDPLVNLGPDLGLFQPGEGKLFKLEPVIPNGGTLACDEYIQGETLNIKDTIYTNGHTLRIGYGTTLNFSDSACIVVNGGSLICGDINQPTHARDIIFKGNNCNWSGVILNNCDTVNINSVQFQNVKGGQNDNNYALKLINCNLVNINNCSFTNSDPQLSGAIEATFATSLFVIPNISIFGNTFTGNSSDKTAISIIANAQSNIPVIIDNNYFSSASNAATAIYLSFITGTEISGNYITGYNKGIEMHYTSIDIIGNTFLTTSGNGGAKGIDAQDYSTANLSVNGSLQTGGLNIFDNTNNSANNIFVNNSSFMLAKGSNQFNIAQNTGSYHLYGYFPGYYNESLNDESSNCFKLDNINIVESNLPVKDVKWGGDEMDVDFNFFGYDCSQSNNNDNMIVDYGNGVYDTISSTSGGNSGGVSNNQIVTPKKLYDSLSIFIRLRNYSFAKAKCYQLLNSFPDSTQGLNSVSKLYLLSVSLDTSISSANECKVFLTSLILNHPNNLPLVRKCNYYIQKCKVKLKEYQSAMTGFLQIIQQNPYTYEALLASWDYSATHLLDSLKGHSGGFSNEQSIFNDEQSVEELVIPEGKERESFISEYIEKMDKKLYNDDDKDAFTKEERKTISTSIVNALDDSKKNAKNHIEILTKKSENGNEFAKVELKVMKTIKEVVKIKRPKTIFEHIDAVNKDIQKLNTIKNETVKKVTNVIPLTYSLSQNYPNPFNPVTKINYELPKDGKVKLVIYDILGREMKSMVNNEFKQAGRYTVEFNGTQFASGVYFYRIQVEGGKGYTAVKKMVLIK